MGARLPHGAEGVERGVDRVSAHIHPLKNIGAFGYIIPLSIELQKSRWLFQASGYYLKPLDLRRSARSSVPLGDSRGLEFRKLNVAVGYRFDALLLSRPLAGSRYQHVGLNFSLQPKANRLVPRSASDSKDWADPFVRVVGKAGWLGRSRCS